MNARLVRSLGSAQIAIGAGMILAPRLVAGLSRGPVPPIAILRVLGTREIGQGVLTATRRDARTLTLGAGVDIAHLASMVVLAAASPRWRRAASLSAAMAGASAVAGLALARAGASTWPGLRRDQGFDVTGLRRDGPST